MKNKNEVTIDESCDFRVGAPAEEGEYPFFIGTMQKDIHCKPAQYLTALTENNKGLGFIALARDGSGIVVSYSPEALRVFARQLVAMADSIEARNGAN